MALVNQTIITKTAKETEKLGERTAKHLLSKGLGDFACCVCLFGDLGAGKTAFAKGFAFGLGIKEKVVSPTFVILKKFKIPNYQLPTASYQLFYHIDAYRLKSSKDVKALGLKEILANPENIVLIEWPNNLKALLPKKKINITFEHLCFKKNKSSQNRQNTLRAIGISNNS